MRYFFTLLFWIALAAEETASLKAIVLLANEEDLILDAETLEGMEGVVIWGLDFPGTAADFQKEIFEPEEGKQLDLSLIKEIEESIYNYYVEKNRPFISVSTPSQPIDEGVAQFVITDSRVSEIRVEGNKWTSTRRVERTLGIQEGDPIDENKVIEAMHFLNRNPFRRTDVIYSAGAELNTTDLTLVVQERRPYRFYAGTDNTGTRFTHRGRCFAGFNFGNVFGLDQVLSGQYTASYDFRRFQAGTLQYLIPFSWKHLLNLYGGYSYVQASLSYPNRTNHGKSYQASIRYLIPFDQKESRSQELTFGFDFKATNNTVLFVEFFPTFSNLVNLTQFFIGYEASFYRPTVNTQIEAQLYFSPCEMLPHQTNADFNDLRPGAKNKWVYGVASFRQNYSLPKSFSLFFSAQGQLSSQTLLPSEQLGIGGYSTVRGYDEREYNGDSGLILNLEARTPSFSMITGFRKSKIKDAMQFLGFVDFGFGQDYTAVPGVPKRDYLCGVGPGVRYTMDPYITARFDWGIKLHNQAVFTGGWSMFHFSFIGSY